MQAMLLLLLHDLQETGQMGCHVQLYLKHLNRIVPGDFNLRRCIHCHLTPRERKQGCGGPETERRDHLLLRVKPQDVFCR